MAAPVRPLLGTTPIGLRNARIDGTLRTHHIALLAGRRGKPVPVVYTDMPLDPCAKRLAKPDPGWLWTANWLPNRIPPDLRQTVQRIARWSSHVGRHRYAADRHPELDDTAAPPAKSRRLPPPAPDHVWYKWSRSGHFLGDDPSNWRTGPKDLGERPPRWRVKRKQKRPPRPSTSAGSIHFNGYQWLCPVCGKTCRTIYLPLRRLNLLDLSDPTAKRTSPRAPRAPGPLPRLAQVIEIPQRVTGFACQRCHRVRFFSRTRLAEAWNQLIAYLTAGLLYGHEVERPSWFTTQRQRPYKPRPGAPPAARRQQVRDLLLRGQDRATIARELHITIAGVTAHANKIYQSERVRGQRALVLKYNQPLPPRLILRRDRILALLRANESPTRIARDLGLRLTSVERYARDLRRLGHLPTRRTKRDQVATLHASGLDRHAIARALNMTPQSVSTRLHELRRAGQCPTSARGKAPTTKR